MPSASSTNDCGHLSIDTQMLQLRNIIHLNYQAKVMDTQTLSVLSCEPVVLLNVSGTLPLKGHWQRGKPDCHLKFKFCTDMALLWFHFLLCVFGCWIGTWPAYCQCSLITPPPCMPFGSGHAMHYPLHVRSRFFFLFPFCHVDYLGLCVAVSFLNFFFPLMWRHLCVDLFHETSVRHSEKYHKCGESIC